MCQKCMWVVVPGCQEHLGLPRLPNWIVRSDKADLHNLVVSFTASHGPSDEWHPWKIIFLLGCNKSYVKCSIAYKAMVEMWRKKDAVPFLPLSFLVFYPQCLWKHRDMSPFPTRGSCGFTTNSVTMYSTVLVIGFDSCPKITRFTYIWGVFHFYIEQMHVLHRV